MGINEEGICEKKDKESQEVQIGKSWKKKNGRK